MANATDSADPTDSHDITMRVPAALVARARALCDAIPPAIRPAPSRVLRNALVRGLDELAADDLGDRDPGAWL